MATPAGNSPAARYTREPLVNLNSYDQRKRLSGSSLTAFFKIMELWKVRDEIHSHRFPWFDWYFQWL